MEKIQSGGGRSKKLTVDYVLVYKGIKLAVIEAKARSRKSAKVLLKLNNTLKNSV